jgi:Ca2+-binding RTX toxin-like protein
MKRRPVLRLTSVFSTLAITASLLGAVAPSARAADAETDALVGLVDDVQGFVSELAEVGRFAQSLPTLAVAPGGPDGIGLDDLLTQARSSVINGIDSASNVDQFVDAIDGSSGDISAGRHISFTATKSTNGSLDSIAVSFEATRTIVSTQLDIQGDDPIAPGYPPFTLASGGGVELELTLNGLFTLNHDSTDHLVWLTRDGSTTPSVSIHAEASIPTPSAVEAGLGILGVTLGDGTSYTLDATIGTSWADPNNDGRLAFDEAGGSNNGELAADGAAAGIVSPSLGGSLNATLVVVGRESTEIDLPDVSATVTVASPNIATTPVDVSFDSNAFDTVKGFLTLSPRDLAQGLAQATAAVMAMQEATGVELPFMRGDLADAIPAVEAIQEFLLANVEEPDPGTETPGLPSFPSLQDMLEDLQAEVGVDTDALIDILDAEYFSDTRKVYFGLNVSRGAGSPQDLNPVGAPTTGTANYTNTELTDGSADFNDVESNLNETGSTLVGRQVVAGASSGVILSIVDDSTLELDPAPVGNPTPDVRWLGGKPADGTAYAILAMDPQIGLVEFENTLSAMGGIANANANVAIADVTPSYTLTIPIVLDLRDPDTTDCDPGPGTHSCPFENVIGDSGISQLITSLPLTADRIMLRTGDTNLLTADAPIETDFDINATVGFVGVHLHGTLNECTTNSQPDCEGTTNSGDHLLTIDLNAVAEADAQGDIPFTTFFTLLADAIATDSLGSLFDFDVDGQAYASLDVSVPGAGDFFGGSDPTADVTIALSDIFPLGTLSVTGPELDKLLALNVDTSNPLALFGALLQSLQAVEDQIGALPGTGGLNTKLPLVGKSFKELIGSGASGGGEHVSYSSGGGHTTLTDTEKNFTDSFIGRDVHVGSQEARITDVSEDQHSLILEPALPSTPVNKTAFTVDSELQGLINVLQDDPSETLQGMLNTLAEKLGGDSSATFAVLGGTEKVLKLVIDWKRSYEAQVPMNLGFDLGGSDYSIVGAQATGLIDVTADGEIKLDLRLPLTMAAMGDPVGNLSVGPQNSFIKAGVDVNGDGTKLTANLGPFQASLGNPTGDPGTQLQAGLGVDLSNPATDPVSLGTFASGLNISVSGDGVECSNAPDPGDTDLAFCAVFPLYINGVLAGSDAAHGNLVVRLPVGTDLADTFDLTPTAPQINGTDRLIFPDNLASTLASAALNLLTFGDGLFGYLEFLENGMRLASFDGKLPLIGNDLQAGADFIGGFHADLETAFGSAPTDTTAGAIRDFLRDTLEPELPGAGALDIDLTCTTPLQSAEAPTVTKNGSGSGTMYTYKIVAYTVADGETKDTVPGAASTPVDHAATLDGTNFNHLEWSSVPHATGYKVLRQVGAGDFELLKDVGNVLLFDDNGSDTPSAYTPVAEADRPCPDTIPASEVDGFTMQVTLGQGSLSDGGCGGPDCLEATVPLDLGLPGLSLKATDDTGGIATKVGWSLVLELGFDRTEGFFIDTGETDEFEVAATLDAPNSTEARLAFINIEQEKNDTNKHEFAGQFTFDLHDSDSMLTLDEITSSSIEDFVDFVLSGDVDVDWHLAASVDSALPGITTDFLLTWGWSSDAPEDLGNLEIAFSNVKLDAAEFIGGTIKPIVQMVVDVFKPIQPVIDMLFAPMPVLSDLSRAVGGDDVTIASLAQTFSTLAGGPDLEPFLNVLKNIRTLLGALQGDCAPDPSPCLTVGSFKLVEGSVATTDANPGTAASLIDQSGGYSVNNNLLSDLGDKSEGDLTGTGDDTEHPGFSFPFLENPSSIFGLIVGQDVDLVKFDSGPLTLGFEFQQSFGPVYAPPPVNVVVGGGASVTMRIVAGFDTYGIRTAIEKGKADATILDSLFFYTTENGKPIPVIRFEGFLQAGASVSAVIIEVGIVGGIKLTVSFYWNDPNNDGKFRFSEFLATALSNPICLFNVGGELSLFIKVFITLGFSPFSTSFDFTLVNIKLLDFNVKPNCTPPPPKLGGTAEGVLYLFAGKFGGGGPRGHSAWDNQNTADETWVIRQYPHTDEDDAKIVVQALGISEEFDDESNAIHTVVLDGRGYSGDLKVLFQGGTKGQLFTDKVVVVTGSGEDSIRTGSGESWVDAGGGKDEVTTTDRPDLSVALADTPGAFVAGGGEADAITVGNDDADVVMGDGALDFTNFGSGVSVQTTGGTATLNNLLDPAQVAVPNDPAAEAGGDGGDQIAAGLGGVDLYGNGGADKIGTANDNPQADIEGIANPGRYRAHSNTIVGGSGSDRIKSGSADDEIYTGALDAIGDDDQGSGDGASDENTVDTGTGNDVVYGSNAKDFVTTHSLVGQDDVEAYGGGEDDVLIGGAGEDYLSGGPANDYLVAEPATVSSDFPITDVLSGVGGGLARSVTPITLGTPSAEKELVGGGGYDRIYGADGPAEIFGDHPVDDCARQSSPVSAEPEENPTTTGDSSTWDRPDLIIGGEGVDTVQGGGGGDFMTLFGEDDVACGGPGGDDIKAGNQEDLVYGGSGGDVLYGENDADELYANTGEDSVWGGSGTDRIQGNEDKDTLFGGPHDDLILGGTSWEDQDDVGDQLYGDLANDILIGDNGLPDIDPVYPTDLDDTDPSDDGGSDDLWGGDGTDTMYGGLEDDYLYGGNDFDYQEGNNGTDHIYGQAGEDDIIGGSSEVVSGTGLSMVGHFDEGDIIDGGTGTDVIIGDNGSITRGGTSSEFTRNRGMTERTVTPYDWDPADDSVFGGDTINGGDANDVALGEGGVDTIHGDGLNDYLEGNQGSDHVFGDAGQDDILGGSSQIGAGAGLMATGMDDTGDVELSGGTEQDVILGDNGFILRNDLTSATELTDTLEDITKAHAGMTQRRIGLYDVQPTAASDTSGADDITGNHADDVAFGQGGDDRMKGNDGDDHLQGGQDIDFIEGDAGDDDLIGGTSLILVGLGEAASGVDDAADVIYGGGGDDVAAGDNAAMLRLNADANPNYTSKFSNRLTPDGGIVTSRWFRRLDLVNGGSYLNEATDRFGGDLVSGGKGVDVLFGQDGDDFLSGGADDDYAEGGGADDQIRGDLNPDDTAPTNQFPPSYPNTTDVTVDETEDPPPIAGAWPGSPGPAVDLLGPAGVHGQDDLIGGSTLQGFRDGNDSIEGDDQADFELGDNGALVRDYSPDGLGGYRYAIYTERYPIGTPPPNAAIVRHNDPTIAGMVSTRFCLASGETCEVVGAFGDDTMYGGVGDDTMWGQDGDDVMRGGTGRDDMYGELGDDEMYGDNGEDAILGDRGGIVDRLIDGSSGDPASFTISQNQVPAITFTAFVTGTYDRRSDLLHDINGASFVGISTAPKMPHNGIEEGGDDRIRGGGGHDTIHTGFGDDLANGDSGGDWIFGGRGADVMWGGKGCDPASAEDFDGTCIDPSSERGVNDMYLDYLFGGKGGTSPESIAGAVGSDIMDWQPRESYPVHCTPNDWPSEPGTGVIHDPCAWHLMTNTYNDVDQPAHVDNQTHHGVDWMYGGWDRDVMQADLANEGPNTGDRLLDWNGAYNLYTHCNPAYGGFNDVRQLSPSMLTFLQRWSYAVGNGQVATEVTTGGTSAYDEVAIVYQPDMKDHGAGSAFPTTPGHFDSPNACTY